MGVLPDLISDEASIKEISPLMSSDPAAVAAAEEAKALVQAAYVMAMHKPRNFMQARQRILDACKRPAFAESVEYAKPVGNDTVKGPSIRFAELAIQQWGNIRVDSTTTFENDEIRKIRVQVLDLETNASFGRLVTVNKTVERSNSKGREVIRERTNSYGKPVYIVRATEEEMATKESAAISKVVRNEGLRLIPQDIIEEALDTARMARRGGVDDPQERIRKMCDAFASIRVSPDDLADYLGCPPDKASPAQIDELLGVYTAIKSGEANWTDYIQQKDEPRTESSTTKAATALKEKLAKAKDAQPVTEKPQSPHFFSSSSGEDTTLGTVLIKCPKSGKEVDELECVGKPCHDGCPEFS